MVCKGSGGDDDGSGPGVSGLRGWGRGAGLRGGVGVGVGRTGGAGVFVALHPRGTVGRAGSGAGRRGDLWVSVGPASAVPRRLLAGSRRLWSRLRSELLRGGAGPQLREERVGASPSCWSAPVCLPAGAVLQSFGFESFAVGWWLSRTCTLGDR